MSCRLLISAHHLIEDEELRIWAAVGVQTVYAVLGSFATDFRSADFFLQGENDGEGCKPDKEYLTLPATWTCPAGVEPVSTSVLLIEAPTIDVGNPHNAAVTVACALAMWLADGWRQTGKVVVNFRHAVDPTAFYGVRLCPSSAATDDEYAMLLLQALATALWRGKDITIIAGAWLWDSPLSLPFSGAHKVYHPNSAA